MDNIILKFPKKLPDPGQLELPRAQLSLLLHELNKELMQRSLDLMSAANAVEFAAAVRKTTANLSEASEGWKAMSDTIRDSWRI